MKRSCFFWLTLLLLFSLAQADTARIATPGGKLNLRRTPDEKGRIVTSAPNHSLVEVLEQGEEWSEITYKQKTGYVKTSYLLLPSALVGQTVYPDEGSPLIYREPDLNSDCSGIVESHEALRVLAVQEGWAQVEAPHATGWIPTDALSWQRTAPQGKRAWLRLQGMLVQDVTLPGANGEEHPLSAGQAVQVTAVETDRVMIGADGHWGEVSPAAVALLPPEDTGAAIGALSPVDAVAKAKNALRKYATFTKFKLYSVVAPYEETGCYLVCFLNDEDQLLFAALIEAERGKSEFLAAYPKLSKPISLEQLLPQGEVTLALSADTLLIGEVLDATAGVWSTHSIQWQVAREDKVLFTSPTGSHLTASFRPREAGQYRLTVTVTDDAQLTVSASAEFTVTEGEAINALSLPYSQRDGWWEDKAYRKSTLSHSGCAIFTLSHALQEMGFDGEDIRPEALAKTYALCLTSEGTNNERLINESSAVYGFSSQRKLITDEKAITTALQGNTLFTFSIVRGHIALADNLSEDGTMVHILDSAPSATYDRINGSGLYVQTRSGSFRAVRSLEEIEGARWYPETDGYGGLSYYLPLSYIAKRGVRLIQPAVTEAAPHQESDP